MILPLMKVLWMDVESQEVFNDSIEKLYQKYSYIEKDNEITFNDKIVKITDWVGWTDLISLKKTINISEWYGIKISYDVDNVLYGTKDQSIPVYDTSIIFKGFHGETKYLYKIISLENLNNDNTIRSRLIDDEFTNNITITKQFVNPVTGYSIITKSGFYNVEGFYLAN